MFKSSNCQQVIASAGAYPSNTAGSLSFTIGETNIKTFTSANKAFGSNQIELEPNTWAFYSGDINQDENIDLIDASLLQSDINSFQFGYLVTDMNGDSNADILDLPILEGNISSFIYSIHP